MVGVFTLKEKCIMIYLSGEDPIVETTNDRNFKIGDIVISDNNVIYEILDLSNICKLSNIAKNKDFLFVDYGDLNELLPSKKSSNLSFKYEKVIRIINTKW